MAAAMPPSLKATEVIAAPLPVPAASPSQSAAPVAVPQPEPAPAPIVVAAPQRRPMPSLISSAHAETLPPTLAAAKPAAPGNRNAGRIFVQAGAFAVPENAQRVRARIASLGNAEIVPGTSRGSALYRGRIGPVASETEARRLLSRVVDHGYPEARVVDQ